ncbi:MAG: DUF58 domain-containing protein [Victivallaceae bacterium]|nr:DUF58 domain-containing protein [Victivallaceae bacterium]
MDPAELLKKVRRLEIRTNREVDEAIGGAYKSVFQGRGIEFDEVREYTPGDDSRDIDWNVTARIGAPFVKKYTEERELTVMLLVDVSASGCFGVSGTTKRERAVEAAAILALSAIRNHDKVGLMMFSDSVELFLSPRNSRRHGLRLIRELVAHEAKSKGTDIDLALRECRNLLSQRSVVFVISDLIARRDFSKSLRILNNRHDVVVLRLGDPGELALPKLPGFTLEDAETGETLQFSGGAAASERYAESAAGLFSGRADICSKAGVDMVEISADKDALLPMIYFFRHRRRRRGV